MFDHLDHWKTYPAKSSFIPSDAVGNDGEKIFEQPLIAAQSGEQSIPGLTFSYFNPNTHQYELAHTPAIEVVVADSLASGTFNALSSSFGMASPQSLRPDHRASQDLVSELRPLYFRVPFLAIPTALALLLAGSWFFVRPSTARATSKAAERALKQLEVAARAGDSSSFFEAARRVLLQAFATRWQIPADQITGAEFEARLGTNAEEIRRLFAIADESKYSASQAGGTEFQHWLRLIRGQLAAERK
jgi:hypothetical protein